MVRQDAPRGCARARPRRRTDPPPEARLSLPLRAEVAQPREAERGLALDAGPRGVAENSARPGDCGRGCVVADVGAALGGQVLGPRTAVRRRRNGFEPRKASIALCNRLSVAGPQTGSRSPNCDSTVCMID